MDESYSYGAHQTRDASTISPTTKEEALVIADDLTSLPNLTGYIRFPGKFPSAMVTIPYVDYEVGAEGFIPNAPPPLLLPDDDDDSGRKGTGGGPDIAELHPEGETLREEARQDNIVYVAKRNSEIADIVDASAAKKVTADDVIDPFESISKIPFVKRTAKVTGEGANSTSKPFDYTHQDKAALIKSNGPKLRDGQVGESDAGKLAQREAQQDFSQDPTKTSPLANRDGDELDHDI